jgi:hypothetical protein
MIESPLLTKTLFTVGTIPITGADPRPIEHDLRIRERSRKARDVAKLRVKHQGIEREAETAKDRKTLPECPIAEQAGRRRIVRIEERSIGVPGRAIANAAESVAAGARERGKHRLDAAAKPQIGRSLSEIRLCIFSTTGQ